MKYILLTSLLIFCHFFGFTQTQSIAYPTVGKGVATAFVTDYHCLGINPSALGWGTGYEGKRFTMGTSEFGFGMISDSLDSKKMRNLSKTLYQSAVNKDPSQIDYQRQLAAAGDFSQSGLSIVVDYNWLGFSFQTKKFGGIAFNIQEHYQWYSKLNQQTSDLIFRGKLSSLFDSLTIVVGQDTSRIANNNSLSSDTLSSVIQGTISTPISLSQITKGSEIKMLWTRSYNLGYGRRLFGKDSVFEVYGGIGARIISSMAMFNMQSDNNGLYMYSSISPSFNINYQNGIGGNFSGGIPPAVGTGYGIDLSGSINILNKLKLALSVNNIGSVTYKRNVYKAQDTLFGSFSLNGLSTEDITKSINQMLKSGGILNLQGVEKYTLQNAANIRFGANFEPFKMLRVGIDIVAPFNKDNPGSIQNPVYSVGGDFRPVKWVQFSAGYYGGGVYQKNVPLGLTIILKDGGYEFGIASRDALSFFTKNGHSVSTAFGFARFRF